MDCLRSWPSYPYVCLCSVESWSQARMMQVLVSYNRYHKKTIPWIVCHDSVYMVRWWVLRYFVYSLLRDCWVYKKEYSDLYSVRVFSERHYRVSSCQLVRNRWFVTWQYYRYDENCQMWDDLVYWLVSSWYDVFVQFFLLVWWFVKTPLLSYSR